MDLRIYIKQTQQLNINQQPIYYDGANPQSLKLFNGGVPTSRQWPNFTGFTDVTDQVSDLYKLKLTWTQDRDLEGTTTPGAFQPKKSVSGNLTFEANAYKLLKKWLIDDVSAPLNSVDVKIEHVGCGFYEEYMIKCTDLKWCEDGDQLCNFEINIRQKDPALSCIQRTMIADNHLGWFPNEPGAYNSGKKHPRFSYCNEIRPNGLLVLVWWNGATVWTLSAFLLAIIYTVINIIIAIIKFIVLIVNLIIDVVNVFGAGLNHIDSPDFFSYNDIIQDFEQKFVESAGCGREHPAPLVRDYIYNVCKKCGIDTDSLPVTAPIFFSDHITVHVHDTSRGNKGVFQSGNPHYNVTYFNAPIKRGIRRFGDINIIGSTSINTTDYWIADNAPELTGDMLLDQLKAVYNAEWRVVTVNNKPTLYFQRKDYYLNGGAVLDFTENGADRLKLLQGICFEWNETKTPVLLKGIYAEDGIDVCGNEARQPMNGAGGDGISVAFGNVDDNPNFDGILDKTVQFGATKFRMDGASTDYILDAMQVVVNGAVIVLYLIGVFKSIVAPAISRYADYALLLKDETAVLPKLIIWDGKSYENARSVPSHSAYPGMAGYTPPVPHNYYNSTQWWDKHPPKTKVLGQALQANTPGGVYKVQAGPTSIAESPAVLMNYPMYFEPGYEDTLWDWFHWIDDPRVNPTLHLSWTAKVELCCDMLKGSDPQNPKLNVMGDGSGVALGQKVKLPLQWFSDSRIKEITVSYDPEDELGQYIEIKGTA